MTSLLKIEKIKFLYRNSLLLNDLSLLLNEGEIVTIIGRSGSGKTTLFKILTGILTVSEGNILFKNREIDQCHSQIGYMTQEDLLLPWRNVIQNITLCSELGKQPVRSSHVEEKAYDLLEQVEMKSCAHMFPHQLSGGMRQRVALARALFNQKPLLLLDEPFAALDVSLREQMYTILRRIRANYNTTILLVTHDFRDAITLSDRVFLLSNGQIGKEWILNEEIKEDPYSSAAILKEMRKNLN